MPRRHHESHDLFDDGEGNAIGLTRAFSPVEADEYFDGTVPTDPFDTPEPQGDADLAGDFAGADPAGSAAFAGPVEAAEPAPAPRHAGKHARHARPAAEPAAVPSAFDDPELPLPDALAPEPIPEYLRKSKRMRRILIGVIVVFVILLAVGGVLAWQLLQAVQTTASQQAQNVTQEVSAIDGDAAAKDASTATAKKTTVPDLTALLGLTQDEAIERLQHGAQVSSTREVNEEGNPVKQDVRIALTAEPADTRSGTPTVYLGLNEEGRVVQAGYSAATSSLGYGSLSFSDAVRNEHIIEKTLAEAGVQVPDGAVVLPEDKTAYSTYASDGTTLTKEYCSFSGEVDIDGAPHAWSAVLSYDYAMANATGNLADTIRTIYVYVNA
ncbi:MULTISPECIES: histone-lysine N-methyltransferase [unclassified Adlercreutzia]|uniref:histone-lysine N-methyltransferase n=1 Tax=unclassified Adlercreutzia TaxID=2636013 RepID=UPI00197E8C8E|nr:MULTISPECIES: histone-lysine N-methyltransferase [unclassified Adlercreutzia]